MAPSFTYRRAVPDSAVPLAEDSDTFLAGGTDLVPLIKGGLVAPSRLVDLKGSGLSRSIEATDAGWTIGAMCTLAQLEDHDGLAESVPVLTEAVAQAATRQLRNRATVGGNLLQRARCSYFRDDTVECWLKGGKDCPARTGRHEHHAIFGDSPCVAVQPSDLASALVALDATVHVEHGDEQRALPVADFLAVPTDDHRSMNTLGDGEVITSIFVPVGEVTCSAYVKVMERAVWAFALVGLAAAVQTDDDDIVRSVRLVATGVAATPWRLTSAEHELIGRSLNDPETADVVARRAADQAVPLDQNAYKVPMLEGVTRRLLAGLGVP